MVELLESANAHPCPTADRTRTVRGTIVQLVSPRRKRPNPLEPLHTFLTIPLSLTMQLEKSSLRGVRRSAAGKARRGAVSCAPALVHTVQRSVARTGPAAPGGTGGAPTGR